ncbi:MAG: hypothetical protein ACREUH_05085 [Burkholderiales bacterium]
MSRCIVLSLLLSLSQLAYAQEVGRLFFTPEQRAALDARRKARVPDRPAPTPVAVSPTTRLDGYVRRSDGRSTVWVNGASVDEAAPQGDGRVSVSVGESRARVRLKPGEELDRGSGEVTDVLGRSGEVRVHRRRD